MDPFRTTHNHSHLQQLEKMWSNLIFGRSNANRQITDGLIAKSFRNSDERREEGVHHSQEVRFLLHQRMEDLKLWLNEFTRKSEEVTEMICKVSHCLRRVDAALKKIPPILQADFQALELRKGRKGVDQVEDDPNKKIKMEIVVLNNEEAILSNVKAEGLEALRLLRKMGFFLQKQIQDRRMAFELDKKAFGLTAHSEDVVVVETRIKDRQMLDSIMKNATTSTESDWEKFSQALKTASERLLKDASNFLSFVESTLRQTCEKVQTALCSTNAAIEERLVHFRRQKSLLEEEHSNTSISVREMENAIDKLKKSVVEKESLLALTEKRISLRSQRPNLELVRDRAHFGLQRELGILHSSIHSLHEQLEFAGINLKRLFATQLRLEEEINVKLNSIAIDEAQVLPLRKTISPIQINSFVEDCNL